MFLRSVDLASAKLIEIIVLLQCFELLLQNCRGFHRSEDRGNAAMDFERCRLVAGCLADDDLLDELARDVDERLLRFRVRVLAQVIECRIDDPLDSFGTDFRLQLPDLLPEIFLRRRLLQARLEAGTAFLKRVEHIVEGGKARPALGCAIADLLDDLALFLFGMT
ncbi:hypothetical protein [Rhizobium cremeum]|uniref:hypothetical protein n=1 Tax=Rhizobium cremeum TaxID=2813827 RepID=UPI0039E030F2